MFMKEKMKNLKDKIIKELKEFISSLDIEIVTA